MWGLHPSQVEAGWLAAPAMQAVQASVLPSSEPLQLVLGLLLTIALFAARG